MMRAISTRRVMVLFGILSGMLSHAFGQDVPPSKAEAPQKPAKLYVPPPPPTTDEMRAQMNGLSLPTGFTHEPAPLSPNGEVGGRIVGPDKLQIAYWVASPIGYQVAPGQTAFESLALKLKEGQHQWSQEQHVGDELVQLTLTSDNTLAVSYPNRGVNMRCKVNGLGELSDALLVTLSVTNARRYLSWDKVRELFEKDGVKSVTTRHTGVVYIHMTDETVFETRQPNRGALNALLRALGKEDKIGIATD